MSISDQVVGSLPLLYTPLAHCASRFELLSMFFRYSAVVTISLAVALLCDGECIDAPPNFDLSGVSCLFDVSRCFYYSGNIVVIGIIKTFIVPGVRVYISASTFCQWPRHHLFLYRTILFLYHIITPLPFGVGLEFPSPHLFCCLASFRWANGRAGRGRSGS
ncbi:unnamed protein product [Ectocarpus sp. 12 AP-2014]